MGAHSLPGPDDEQLGPDADHDLGDLEPTDTVTDDQRDPGRDTGPGARPPAPDVIESKVVASSVMALLVGILVAVGNAAVGDSRILGGLPPWAQAVLLAVVPPVVTFAGGWAQPSNRV